MAEEFDPLKLENQLCFPLYACSKEIVRRYAPLLEPLDLTYTQYITMMLMWEYRQMTVKDLGDKLWLDSGTMTPVLKKLEAKGYIRRERSTKDERSVTAILTDEGMALREKALQIPAKLGSCVRLDVQEMVQLHLLLHKIMAGFEQEASGD